MCMYASECNRRGSTCYDRLFIVRPAKVRPTTKIFRNASNQREVWDAVITSPKKYGVLLLNLGGPSKLEDVQPFLYNLFSDPDIIRLPKKLAFLQKPLAKIISSQRAQSSKEGYAAIGGASPLLEMTLNQSEAIKRELFSLGFFSEVYVGMRYWDPFTEEALLNIKGDGITDLIILPLYPQFSISTSGSSLRLIESLFKSDANLARIRHTVIPSWYQRHGYINAMSELIARHLRENFVSHFDVHIFFSAHGVPESYVTESGDPYEAEMEHCVSLIIEQLRSMGIFNDYTLAYQSRVGPVQWLRPYTDESIRNLGRAGIKSLMVVPISFVSEHIETLEEIDIEYRNLAHSCGICNWARVPALGTDKLFISDIANAIIEASKYSGQSSALSTVSTRQPVLPLTLVSDLLDTYDENRSRLPVPYNKWELGLTPSAELWNGRLAMLLVTLCISFEFVSGHSFFRNIYLPL